MERMTMSILIPYSKELYTEKCHNELKEIAQISESNSKMMKPPKFRLLALECTRFLW